MCMGSSSWLHVANEMVGNFTSIQDNYWEKNIAGNFLPSTGIIWDQCCICPAYIRMPHVTDLGSQEFQQMMVVDAVVTKKFYSGICGHEN